MKDNKNKTGWYKHANGDHPKWLMHYDFETKKGHGFGTFGDVIGNWGNHDSPSGDYIGSNDLVMLTEEEIKNESRI